MTSQPTASTASASVPPPAVLVRDLNYHYPDGRHALRGVDIAIGKGETAALVGPNGAGKSTLLLHLNGLLPGRERANLHSHGVSSDHRGSADAGVRVWIDGIAVEPRNLARIRGKVGLLFQDPDDQLFSTSVLEDVAFGPLNLGLGRDEARSVAMECLAKVDLESAAGRAPHHLSFGERKRVCLAGVLACRPSVLVLDEPTANLDPRGRRKFIEMIRSLDATKLIATHDLEMALELCSRTILLDAGRVETIGPSLDVFQNATLLEKHGLETPLSVKYNLRRAGGNL